MAIKSNYFGVRFPHAGLFLVIAVVLAIPLTVWSLSNVSTQTQQYAARGGNGKPTSGSGTINMVMVTDKNQDGLPNWGDTVTFNISTTISNPWVHLSCYQNGNLVASGWAGYFDGAIGDKNFGLYSPTWTSGAADCKADLDQQTNKGWNIITSTSFHVNP